MLETAGYDMSLDSGDWASIQYQNANNSVRVTDEFMRAVEADSAFGLRARMTGEVIDFVGEHGTTSQGVAMLRDPVERAYSHWKERRTEGVEPLSFAEALAGGPVRAPGGAVHGCA